MKMSIPFFCSLLCECIVFSKFRGLVINWSKVKDGPLCAGIGGGNGAGGGGRGLEQLGIFFLTLVESACSNFFPMVPLALFFQLFLLCRKFGNSQTSFPRPRNKGLS